MNIEHYRLEALKLAVSMKLAGVPTGTIELSDYYYQWIIKDQVKAEEAKKEAELPQYKIPPNQSV